MRYNFNQVSGFVNMCEKKLVILLEEKVIPHFLDNTPEILGEWTLVLSPFSR